MTPHLRQALFETLYRNKYLYRFASTVPFAGQWRTWQRQVLPRLRGHDVLELGCGLGDLLADMQDAGYECHAIEHSPQMLKAARETQQKRKHNSPGLITQGSAQSLPFPADSFDNVVSTFPSEYIYDPATLAEIARVLRPGGQLIVIESANLLPVGFFQPILLLLHMFVYGPATLLRTRKKGNLEGTEKRNAQQRDLARNVTSANEKARQDATTTRVLENAWFGQQIPLEQHGLRRRSELVSNPRWEVYIISGEKS